MVEQGRQKSTGDIEVEIVTGTEAAAAAAA